MKKILLLLATYILTASGLTERAIEAAKRIKFTPAMKDGKPVSVWMQLEYNFSFSLDMDHENP